MSLREYLLELIDALKRLQKGYSPDGLSYHSVGNRIKEMESILAKLDEAIKQIEELKDNLAEIPSTKTSGNFIAGKIDSYALVLQILRGKQA